MGSGTGFWGLVHVLFLNVSTLPLQAIGQPIPENFAELLSTASSSINTHTDGVGQAIVLHSTGRFDILEAKLDRMIQGQNLALRRQEGTCTAADLEGKTYIAKREINKDAIENLLTMNRAMGPGAAAELAELRRVAKGGQPKQRKVKAIVPELGAEAVEGDAVEPVAGEAVEPEPAGPSAKDLMKAAMKQHKEEAKTAAAAARTAAAAAKEAAIAAKAAALEHIKELAAAAALEPKSTRRAPKSKAAAAPEPEPVPAEVAAEVAAPEPETVPAEVASGSNEAVAKAVVGPTSRIKNLRGSSLFGFRK